MSPFLSAFPLKLFADDDPLAARNPSFASWIPNRKNRPLPRRPQEHQRPTPRPTFPRSHSSHGGRRYSYDKVRELVARRVSRSSSPFLSHLHPPLQLPPLLPLQPTSFACVPRPPSSFSTRIISPSSFSPLLHLPSFAFSFGQLQFRRVWNHQRCDDSNADDLCGLR